jgi:hypothetical protein
VTFILIGGAKTIPTPDDSGFADIISSRRSGAGAA